LQFIDLFTATWETINFRFNTRHRQQRLFIKLGLQSRTQTMHGTAAIRRRQSASVTIIPCDSPGAAAAAAPAPEEQMRP